jgi:hypothetical protein
LQLDVNDSGLDVRIDENEVATVSLDRGTELFDHVTERAEPFRSFLIIDHGSTSGSSVAPQIPQWQPLSLALRCRPPEEMGPTLEVRRSPALTAAAFREALGARFGQCENKGASAIAVVRASEQASAGERSLARGGDMALTSSNVEAVEVVHTARPQLSGWWRSG